MSENPSIPYVIEFILLKDKEFTNNSNMEIKDVRRILKDYNLIYKGSSLSTELQKSGFVECKQHPTKKNTNVYSKK
ncbi:hypothetical protein [Sphingobacterium arenae]|uniref:Transposase n=1 Tax=Sphingobacterium arenae TaxID=1280598 RepID=A0ABR7Y8T3_9SPHI|nr:hypothetical protein [Sphingobacterium arenae]MBD1427705.1 hypothetical protein [Sphingobacterium arenae]